MVHIKFLVMTIPPLNKGQHSVDSTAERRRRDKFAHANLLAFSAGLHGLQLLRREGQAPVSAEEMRFRIFCISAKIGASRRMAVSSPECFRVNHSRPDGSRLAKAGQIDFGTTE